MCQIQFKDRHNNMMKVAMMLHIILMLLTAILSSAIERNCVCIVKSGVYLKTDESAKESRMLPVGRCFEFHNRNIGSLLRVKVNSQIGYVKKTSKVKIDICSKNNYANKIAVKRSDLNLCSSSNCKQCLCNWTPGFCDACAVCRLMSRSVNCNQLPRSHGHRQGYYQGYSARRGHHNGYYQGYPAKPGYNGYYQAYTAAPRPSYNVYYQGNTAKPGPGHHHGYYYQGYTTKPGYKGHYQGNAATSPPVNSNICNSSTCIKCKCNTTSNILTSLFCLQCVSCSINPSQCLSSQIQAIAGHVFSGLGGFLSQLSNGLLPKISHSTMQNIPITTTQKPSSKSTSSQSSPSTTTTSTTTTSTTSTSTTTTPTTTSGFKPRTGNVIVSFTFPPFPSLTNGPAPQLG